jgi:hypothetical protein
MTELFDIKADKRLFHHYIIGVGMHDHIKSEKCGQFYLKYGPVHFTHDDIENVRDAVMLSKDEVFKTTSKEAAALYGCNDLISTLYSMKYACRANKVTMHHFSSECELEDDFFISMVESAHKIESFRQKLKESITS